MGSVRFLRSSVLQQLCCRGLSTEPAVAAFTPPKVAVKTQNNDPTNHTREDIGKIYTMPDSVRHKLFPKHVLPLYYERFVDTFLENFILVRSPALELMEYLKRADYDRPVIRYALYGEFGCGKTLTAIHVLNYAYNNNFIIVSVPYVWRWYHWGREVVAADREPGLIDFPIDAAIFLKHFELTNSELVTKLDLRTSKRYEWNQRERTEEGAPLGELISFGVNRVKYACQVVDALLAELKLLSTSKRCKTFVCLDGYNGFFQTTCQSKLEHKHINPANVSLTKSFVNFVKNDWSNGAVVLIVDDHASVNGEFNSYTPFHLLRKAGVESIDPFIPIHVPEYSPLEFHNYLDYLEEKRWLQKPGGRDEIEFVSQRNPRYINAFVANR